MIITSIYICTTVHLYTITLCTEGVAVHICVCLLLVIVLVTLVKCEWTVVHVFVNISKLWICLWHCLLPIISLHLCYVRPFPFYSWHHVILLSLRDDNTTGSLWLYHLFYMFCVNYESSYRCTSKSLYTIMICTNGMNVDKCLCALLAALCGIWLGECLLTCDVHLLCMHVDTV